MRVLIVDGFPPTSQGRQDLEDFKCAIKSSLEGPYKSFLDSIAFAVRDKLGLEDFLYDPTTEFTSRAALGSFRAIDFVFVGGDANLLPWQSSCRQLIILLKACMREHKPAFLTALGMQCLCHLCAVGCEKITVFNGRGRGGALSTLHAMPEHVCLNLRPCDLFLDAATGDLYRKTNEFGDFSKYKNVGLSDPELEPTMKRLPYKAHQLDPKSGPSAVRRTECVAEVADLRLLQHHLLQGVPREFLVPALHLWQVHDRPPPPLEVIASSTRGPQLVQFGPICGAQFTVRRKYPETGKILANWMENMCAKLRAGKPPGFCPDTLGHEITSTGEASKWEARLKADLKRARANSEGRSKPVGRPMTAPDQHQSRQQASEANSAPPRSAPANADSQHLNIGGNDFQPPDAQLRAFSRAEIRKMLHPEIDISDVEPFEPVKTIRAPVQPQNPPCRWRYYKSMQPGARQKRPHSSPGNVRSNGTFRTAVGKATTGDAFPNALGHYVQGTPGPFIGDHSFRPEQKENWQNGTGMLPFSNTPGWQKFQVEPLE
eukprot:gnl/MRDRNA2_/MRDRNA2_91110_c0_seq1.p1 gnl/MRDRNA2_/MRDRNA2_91110_c0~~gnl/MRDRNA2_/MRDRNA2_91110_c0_seq1.p1  ORF type:complete len:544 (+),score=87.38 gnl/MRDRNA2_/MRDRNA2_91110_c0_seq1:89-1720(+)